MRPTSERMTSERMTSERPKPGSQQKTKGHMFAVPKAKPSQPSIPGARPKTKPMTTPKLGLLVVRPKAKQRTGPKRSLLVCRPKSRPELKLQKTVHEIALADPYGGIAGVLASEGHVIAEADPHGGITAVLASSEDEIAQTDPYGGIAEGPDRGRDHRGRWHHTRSKSNELKIKEVVPKEQRQMTWTHPAHQPRGLLQGNQPH